MADEENCVFGSQESGVFNDTWNVIQSSQDSVQAELLALDNVTNDIAVDQTPFSSQDFEMDLQDMPNIDINNIYNFVHTVDTLENFPVETIAQADNSTGILYDENGEPIKLEISAHLLQSIENGSSKVLSFPDNEAAGSSQMKSQYPSLRYLDHRHFNGTLVPYSEESVPLEVIERNEPLQQVVSTVPQTPSSLPASQSWSGEYGFDVSFSLQEKSTKGVSWTYSRTMDKLYVGKDAPCPVNFSTNVSMPENVKIRATTLYSSPESASEVVKRCENHSLEERMKGVFEAEHLVRCESSAATYEVDPVTKRHSVVVPFENPPAGQHFSTYIYKFTCFGSCPFGPNRRPLMLVFSLESGNQVIGRRKIDVKICACPGRDRKSDEQSNSESGSSKKRKEPEFVSLAESFDFTKQILMPSTKKARVAPNQDGQYTVTVDNYECFELLQQIKKFYDLCKTMRNLPSDTRKTLANYCQKKGYVSEQDENNY